MKILRRYLLWQHFWPFVFAFTAITAFELLRQIARRLPDLLGKGLPGLVIVEFFVLTLPFLIAVTLSMSVLVAVLHTMSRLAGDNEITAMRAGGVSLGQILRPILTAGVVVAVISFAFGDQVLPRTNHRLRDLMVTIYRTKPTFSLKEHVINEVQRQRTSLWAAQIDQATYRMRDVTLYNMQEQDRKRIIYADSGKLDFAPNREDLLLTLFDGSIHEFDRNDPQMFQQTLFQRQLVLIRGVGGDFVRREEDSSRSERELSVCELDERIRQARSDAWRATYLARTAERNGLRGLVYLPAVQPDSTPPTIRTALYCRALGWLTGLVRPAPLQAQGRWQPPDPRAPAQDSTREQLLADFNEPARQAFRTGVMPQQRSADVRIFRDRADGAQGRVLRYKVEYYKKYSIAAACIVFVLIGVPVALLFPRGGMGLVFGAGMVLFGIHYVGLIGGETLADRGITTPFLAMWGSDILTAAVGLVGLWWVSRSGAARARTVRQRRRPQTVAPRVGT
jgi:lipopolysaccharide export system permease protein